MFKKNNFFKNYFVDSKKYYESVEPEEQNLIFKNTLENETESNSVDSDSVENSILKKIQSK